MSLGIAEAVRGGRSDRTKAEAILDGFNRGQLARVVTPVERALISLGLGQKEAALTGLEEAYAARTPRVHAPAIRFSLSLQPTPGIES